MEQLIDKLVRHARRVATWPEREEERIDFEEVLNEYIDARIERSLDRLLRRGEWSER